jgi:triphosphoribosyl-dephospho-CoA synthetase
MPTWEEAILKIISSKGGSASLEEIYLQIRHYVSLTSRHLVITYGVPAFHHQVRAHVDDLMDKGEVRRTARGVYAITAKGDARINSK